MALKIRRQLVTSLTYTGGKGNKKRYLTVHQTDNWGVGANAAAHANLQSRLWPNATWHWTVDDTEAVQSYAHDVVCWHAGDGANGTGNRETIGMEFCLNRDGDYQKAFDNAAALAAHIMKTENIPMSRLVQHNNWSGKNCPSEIRKQGEWAAFRARVERYLAGTATPTPSSPTSKPKKLTVDGYWGEFVTDALQYLEGTPRDSKISSQATIWRNHLKGCTTGWQWVVNPVGSQLIKRLQRKWGVDPDGIFGSGTARAMQKHYGTPITGKLGGKNGSKGIKALQRDINKRLGY